MPLDPDYFDVSGDDDDMVGADDGTLDALLSGDDALVGAVAAQIKRSPLPAARALVAQRAAAARQVARPAANVAKVGERPRELILGFDSGGTVAAGASADVTSQPQVKFRPERLVIPSGITDDFNVTDIKVGNVSQLAAAGAIPASTFSELSVGVRMRMDPMDVGLIVTISVVNVSAGAVRFRASLIGPAAV